MQHAGQPCDRVAVAEEIGALRSDREAAIGARMVDRLEAVGLRESGVLRIAVVVEDDAPRGEIVEMGRVAGRIRRVRLGELARPGALEQLDRAETLKTRKGPRR